MQLAIYDPATGALQSIADRAIDPVRSSQEGQTVYAAVNEAVATDILPPNTPDGQCAVFDRETLSWSLALDHRGETWWNGEGREVIIQQLGNPADEGLSPEAPPPSVGDVERERDRRLALGFTYTFPDERGSVSFGTTVDDMTGWNRVTILKDALFQAGDTVTKIAVSPQYGRTVEVTGPEWNAILLHGAAMHEQPIWQVSNALCAMDPIPADYATDERWPSVASGPSSTERAVGPTTRRTTTYNRILSGSTL